MDNTQNENTTTTQSRTPNRHWVAITGIITAGFCTCFVTFIGAKYGLNAELKIGNTALKFSPSMQPAIATVQS